MAHVLQSPTAVMRYGVHYLLSCAPEQSPARRIRDTIEQAVRAEALGFDSVWPVEQHFMADASVMPSPTLLLAAIAERTRTLRLGTAIVQLPLSHPLRVAEDLAVLDVLSGGRAELGVGRGSNPLHFAGYGVTMDESRGRFMEGLDLIREALVAERIAFKGRFYQVEGVGIAPRPLQARPPIRLAANSVETAELAGSLGLPIICAMNVNPLPRLRPLVAAYRAARVAAGRPAASGDDVSVLVPLFVAPTFAEVEAAAAATVANAARITRLMIERGLPLVASAEERRKLEGLISHLRTMTFAQANDGMGVFDTPDAAVDRLVRIREELGAGRIISWFNYGGLIPHERVVAAMELFSSRVMPRV